MNMGSYNYLGFAENTGPNVDRVEAVINRYGVGVSTTRHEIGWKWKSQSLNLYISKIFRHNSYS